MKSALFTFYRLLSKSFVFFFFWLSLPLSSQVPIFQWVNQYGGSSIDKGSSIKVDGNGDLIHLGFFRGVADFDPSSNAKNLSSAGAEDIYLNKLDSKGNLLWAIRMGGKGSDRGISMALDAMGNIYITGSFQDKFEFEVGNTASFISSIGSTDVFIAKYNTQGSFLWVKQLKGDLADSGIGISTDGGSAIYVTGLFQGEIDVNPGDSLVTFTSRGNNDIFILNLNEDGNFKWARTFGGPLDDQGTAISCDRVGNVIITGSFSDTLDFDPSEQVHLLKQRGTGDMFILKLSKEGNLIWVNQIAGENIVFPNALAVDDVGDIYTTGFFRQRADFDPKNSFFNLTAPGVTGDIFISKLSAEGNFIFAKQLGSYGHDVGLSIALDAGRNIYTTGCFQDTADFDPGPNVYNLIGTRNNNDVFISKLNSVGEFEWAKQISGPLSDIGFSICTDQKQSVYTVGVFGGTAIYQIGMDTVALTSLGGEDIFIHSLRQSVVQTKEEYSNWTIQVLPNPTQGMVYIEYKGIGSGGNCTIQLFSPLQNQKVWEIHVVMNENEKYGLDMSQFNSGIYVLSIVKNQKRRISSKVLLIQ